MSSSETLFDLALKFASGNLSMPQPSEEPKSRRSVAEAAALVETYLRQSPILSEARIWCEPSGESIVIRGRVPAYSTKHAARVLAESVCNGFTVENRLDVVPYPAD